MPRTNIGRPLGPGRAGGLLPRTSGCRAGIRHYSLSGERLEGGHTALLLVDGKAYCLWT